VAVIVGNSFLAGWHDGWAIGYEAGHLHREPVTARPAEGSPLAYRHGWHDGVVAGHKQGRERREHSFRPTSETAA
jgi:hypothetical protein